MVSDATKLPKNDFKVALVLDGEEYDDDIYDDKKPKKWNDTGIISLKKQTETGEALADLTASGKEPDSKMSKIDMRTKLTKIQASGLTRWDILCEMQVFPPEVHFVSPQAKRNYSSIDGWKAEQMKDTAIGISQKKTGSGFMSKITGLFNREGGQQ